MGVKITSAYAGEVLDALLVKVTTGNELVSKGLIRLEPNVSDKFNIPRLKTGKMLQKRKEQPVESDSKGDFTIDEKVLKPEEFMAFTTFNPRSFERFWRDFQPTGELVFSELPKHVQNTLLAELAKVVDFELGDHFVNGVFGPGENQFFNGILTRIVADKDVLKVGAMCGTMTDKLKAVYAQIPKALKAHPKLRILMSVEDADKYDDELSAQTSKGADVTTKNVARFKNIPIEVLSAFPEGVIVATICGMDLDTNLWGAVSLVNDFSAVMIGKLTNAGEKYFFKMLMKVDTQIAFGEEVVLYDERSAFEVSATEVSFVAAGEVKTVNVTACCDYTVSGKVDGFTQSKAGGVITITAIENAAFVAREGVFTVKLKNDTKETIEISVNQAGVTE